VTLEVLLNAPYASGRMRPVRVVAAGLVTGAVLVVAACGGGDDAATGAGGTPEGATFVPANAPAFVAVNTDEDSDTWKTLTTLLAKFPDREQAFRDLHQGLQAGSVTLEEIQAALGAEADAAFLSLQGDGQAFVLTEAEDQAKLDSLIQRLDESNEGSGDTVKEVVDGWTIVSDNQAAIDAAKRAHEGDSLAESDPFEEAMGDLSEDALLRFFVDGASASRQLDAQTQGAATSLAGGGRLESIAGDVTVEENGFGFDLVTRTSGGTEPKTYTSELVSLVPADALLYASFSGVGDRLKEASSNPALQEQLGMIQGALGISVTELANLFQGEAALYVRPGSPFPEVTLALAVENEQQAVALVDRLAQRLAAFAGAGAAPTPTRIGDVDAKRVSLGQFAIYYAGVDGKLVITSAATGIEGLTGGGDKLADDEAFTEAQESAGMPDETAGFVYVNVEDALPLLENFAQTAGDPLPPEARANLEPLRSALFYATAEEGKATVKGFLRIE
jgi:Protein of unknown function (DUF3352)